MFGIKCLVTDVNSIPQGAGRAYVLAAVVGELDNQPLGVNKKLTARGVRSFAFGVPWKVFIPSITAIFQRNGFI